MSDLVPVKRALLSVSDKSGLAEFAKALVNEFGVQLISTGGTAKFLREQGLAVTDVSQVTGFPEMMDGRVKTLHPKIHGGLLSLRDNAEHVAAMKAHGIEPIDLVCINLYPFEKTIAKPDVTFEEAIENIDIGGPSMVRSAAKNHRFVLVVTSPADYEKVLGDLRKHGGSSCGKHRLKQAQKAFAHTASYDGNIADYLDDCILNAPDSTVGDGAASHKAQPHHGSVATLASAAEEPKAVPSAPEGVQPPASEQAQFITPASPQAIEHMLAAPDRIAFLREYASVQMGMIGGIEASVFEVSLDEKGERVLGNRIVHLPAQNQDDKLSARGERNFEDVLMFSVKDGRGGVSSIDGQDKEGKLTYCTDELLWESGQPVAAVTVNFKCRHTDPYMARARQALMLKGYFELFALRQKFADTKAELTSGDQAMPESLRLNLKKQQELRYGENPHQKAALYVDAKPAEASVAYAKQLHGKELSYINLLDADAALATVKELSAPAACVVKHATPCGFATAATLPEAFRKAYLGDPLAAFGGIVALNQPVDLATAQAITGIDKLLEVIVAPSYADDALDLLRSRWKNVRLLAVGPMRVAGVSGAPEFHMHRIVGGYLIQQRDLLGIDQPNWKVVSTRKPTPAQMADLELAWLACKHVKSNAIALAKDGMMVGSGAGQQDRVNAARIAIAKAGERANGSVAASDAFFPFPDGPKLLLDAGITAIIHPGGSVRDQETLDVVNAAGAAMVLTGQRHFKH